MPFAARLCQEKLAEDPFSGCVFVFRSRSGTASGLLTYDGQGYRVAQKRFVQREITRWRPGDAGAASAHALTS
jgi:transposase